MLKLLEGHPGLPGGDTIRGANGGQAELPASATDDSWMVPVAGWDAVWLAPNAALLRSHLSPSDGEPLVIEVVGVADYGNWAGAVLMLD